MKVLYTAGMVSLTKQVRSFAGDRIEWIGLLLVACFVGVLLLESQSGASYPTYLLALLMVGTFPEWRDVLNLGLVRWILGLLLWLCLSALWSEVVTLRETFSVFSRAVLTLCFVVAFAECSQRGKLQHWLAFALTAVGAVVVVAAIINFHVTEPADGRLNGLGQLDTHVVAALIYGVVLLFVVRAMRSHESSVFRALAAIIALTVVYAVFLSDSRNAWVSVSLGLFTYLCAMRCADAKEFLVTVLSVGTIMAAVLGLLFVNETANEILLPRGDSFRPTIWSVTIERVLSDSLIFGRGILTSDDVVVGTLTFDHAHNMYLSLLHQGGLIALSLFLFVIAQTLRVLIRHYEEQDAKLALALMTLALTSYLLDGHELIDKVGETWFLFWLPVGIALGLNWRYSLTDRAKFFLA